MLQDKFGAQARAASPLVTRAAGLMVLAVGLLGLAPSASAAGQAALGIYRCSNTFFYLDGNNDSIADLKVPSAPIPCPVGLGTNSYGLLMDITGSGTRAPATYLNGIWSVDQNRDGAAETVFGLGGVPGDVPMVADMNGDGKDDPVLYRNGAWYVSSSATPGAITTTYYFGGVPGDIPMLADVSGDGVPDLIIYRVGLYGGTWYVSTARNGVADTIFYFGGAPGDIPLAFDYNNDGVADIAIFRSGAWYVSTARNGTADAVFSFGGAANDQPLYAGRGTIPYPYLDATRFLNQASFGPTVPEIANVLSMGYSAWIDDQFAKPVTALPVMAWQPQNEPANCTSPLTAGGPFDPFGTDCPRDLYSAYQVKRHFFMNALTAPDQLRQRVGWALSQIMVTSAALDPIAYANRDYQQMLIDNAFGNFRDLLFWVTVSPFMGNYLDMANNNKANPTTGQQPNENYARELLQLFSVGTLLLNPDGTTILDPQGQPYQTYDQNDITELSKVMTGWTYYPLGATATWNAPTNYLYSMIPCEGTATPCGTINRHETSLKTVLGYTIPPGLSADVDLATAINVIFYHPNVGPFIGKQLIQHLVTSNPSPAYVGRVSAKFNDNGAGVRGDMKAVVKAVLMDPEARAPRNPIGKFGKLKEPVILLTNFLRLMGYWAGAYTDGVDAIRSGGPLVQMGQEIYTSPTVFNYYPSDYVVPGTTLYGPQFGIFDPTTLFARSAVLYDWTLGASCGAAPNNNLCGPNPDTTVAGAVGTKINWASLASLSTNPAALVDQVSMIMLYEVLPPGQRQHVINAVTAVTLSATPTVAQLRDRARTAVYLVAISPKYQVEY